VKKGIILSGMRPTGKLHIGHLSVLENWVKLQEEYDCYYAITDWHALTTSFEDTSAIRENIYEMALDWLSAGIDPQKSAVFVQSDVKEHAELHLLLSMITPLSWLERVPTFKDQINQFKEEGRDISTYGFLGYPLLMAADILVYKANLVPVGEDQLPHLEFSREVVRRFNYIYGKEILVEPQALIPRFPVLPGIDGRKMSKSYQNDIAIDSTEEEVRGKVRLMVTDPARIHKTDPGHPEVCTVFLYHEVYNEKEKNEIESLCRAGKIGCVACKENLARKLNLFLTPLRQKRKELQEEPGLIYDILTAGAEKARQKASLTLKEVREAMGLFSA